MENAFGQPQNVVIFGGSSDIARAITKKLCAARTHSVVLCGRNADLLEAAAEEAQEYGATKVDVVHFDAEDAASAAATVGEAFDKLRDPIDLVIVAVGQLGDQPVDENDPAAVARLFSVNVTWPAAALTEVRRRLVAQGSGRILVISSVAAVRIRRNAYIYGATKAGLDRYCVGMSQSLEGTGVRLHILRPALVRTKMTTGLDEPPFTTGANEVAENVMRGLSRGDDVIWSPPVLRYAAFVISHLPTRVWRKMAER